MTFATPLTIATPRGVDGVEGVENLSGRSFMGTGERYVGEGLEDVLGSEVFIQSLLGLLFFGFEGFLFKDILF